MKTENTIKMELSKTEVEIAVEKYAREQMTDSYCPELSSILVTKNSTVVIFKDTVID